jgi:hypothetical protein
MPDEKCPPITQEDLDRAAASADSTRIRIDRARQLLIDLLDVHSSVMTCIGHCYTCGALMTFSPTLVPSLPGNLTCSGEREPVCRNCVERANPERIKNGLPPIEILPGAYEGDEVA